MAIKASFSNLANVLLDWDDVHNSDFCSWRGVFCDNSSLSVVSLYVLFCFKLLFFLYIKCNEVQCNEWVLVTCRNLSSLNLGGEISPSIGDLRNLQSMYAPFYFLTKPFYYVPNVVVIDLFFLIFAMLAEIFRGIS